MRQRSINICRSHCDAGESPSVAVQHPLHVERMFPQLHVISVCHNVARELTSNDGQPNPKRGGHQNDEYCTDAQFLGKFRVVASGVRACRAWISTGCR